MTTRIELHDPFVVTSEGGGFQSITKDPVLTVLNFSAGGASSALLWMLIRGEIDRPESLAVLNANPGMESSETYRYLDYMRNEAAKAGIDIETVKGPSLYDDLVNIHERARMDNPPYFTKGNNGKRGKLKQLCTSHYKIAPMDRRIREILEEKHGISRKSRNIGAGIVHKWIGFSFSEVIRIKPPQQKYVSFRYPLIEARINNQALAKYFADRGLPKPPRSVCNACFANDAKYYRDMAASRPQDFAQAVAVDEAVRDMSRLGVKHQVFVSDKLIPLVDLISGNSGEHDNDNDLFADACNSGYCFT